MEEAEAREEAGERASERQRAKAKRGVAASARSSRHRRLHCRRCSGEG